MAALADDQKQGGNLEGFMKDFAAVGAEKNYQGQAVFFLNAMWAEYGNDAETFWGYVELAGQLDKARGPDGNAMDEFEVLSHCTLSLSHASRCWPNDVS